MRRRIKAILVRKRGEKVNERTNQSPFGRQRRGKGK